MLKSHNIVGASSEMMVSAYLAGEGVEVFFPFSPHTRADLVYIDEGKVRRVQVKTSTWSCSSGDYEYEQCRVVGAVSNRPYTKEEIDELWIVGTHLWCFPVSFLDGRTMIGLGTTHPKPRKTVRNYDPNDYIVVTGSFDRMFKNRVSWNDPQGSLSESNHTYSDLTQARIDRAARRVHREGLLSASVNDSLT